LEAISLFRGNPADHRSPLRVSYPSFLYHVALEELGEPADEEALTTKLLDMAENAILAEDEHLLESVNSLLDKAEQSLKAQLAERSDTLDAYLESFDPEDKHDLQNELSALLGMPIRLAPSQQKALLSDPRGQKPWLQETLRTNLTLLQVRRLLLTLERRFNESWPVKAADLAAQPWKEIRSQILTQIQGTIERRKQRLLGPEGEIARDLAANQEHLSAALTDQNERLRLLQLTTQGMRVTFDPKSHRRQLTPALRLTYVYSLAQQLEQLTAQQVTEQVLTHLEEAQAVFQTIFRACRMGTLA